MQKEDLVNHPSHYTKGEIEVHDFISAWNMDFDTGNVVKYVTRAPYKGRELEDLKKARWYLNELIVKAEVKEQFKAAEDRDKHPTVYNIDISEDKNDEIKNIERELGIAKDLQKGLEELRNCVSE